jgi:hypothetical protein
MRRDSIECTANKAGSVEEAGPSAAPPNGRWAGVMISGAIGFSAKSAGPLKRKNLLSYCLRKIDQGELLLVEKIILPALVDDPHEVVLGRPRIGHDSIDLPKDQ